MFSRRVSRFLFGWVLIALLGSLPGCQSTPKAQPEALTGWVENANTTKIYKVGHARH